MFNLFKKSPDNFTFELHISPMEVIGLIKDVSGTVHEDFRLRRNDPGLFDPLLLFKIDEIITKMKMLNYSFGQANVFIFFPSNYFIRDHINHEQFTKDLGNLENKICAQCGLKKEELLFNYAENKNQEIMLSAMPKKLADKIVSIFKNHNIALISIKPDNPAIRQFGE